MSTRSLTPRGFTETQAPPNDGDVWVYDAPTDKSAPVSPATIAPTAALAAARITAAAFFR